MPLLTIFSAPKPFTDPHIALIQRNAIHSWLHLGSDVEVILVGEEVGLAEAAQESGARHLPGVLRNNQGTPLVSSMFDLVRRNSNSPLLACVNADILLRTDFLRAAQAVANQARDFLVVGQRWDLDVTSPLDFTPDWEQRLLQMARQHGSLHPRMGSDYFIFPRGCFSDIPDFAIGRAGWDNWMIFKTRWEHWLTIDASGSVEVVHQNHDYNHLPGGQIHYRLPESEHNYRLAGGRFAKRFTLLDANRRLVNGKLVKFPLSRERLQRGFEIFPLVGLHSIRLGRLFYRLFSARKKA
jgi:hypothetical protein